MKLKNVAVVVAALVLAVGMTACGGSSSTAASSTAESAASSVASVSASSEAASSEAASSEAASSEAASSEAASSEAASSVAASSVAASSEAAESETAAASVVSTEDLDVNGTTYSADCYGEFTLSNGDTMKLWKVKDAYADLSALPMKGMAEEFPIEAEAEQIYVADVTSNGETTRQYLRTDKAGRNGTVSVKTFELGDAE